MYYMDILPILREHTDKQNSLKKQQYKMIKKSISKRATILI